MKTNGVISCRKSCWRSTADVVAIPQERVFEWPHRISTWWLVAVASHHNKTYAASPWRETWFSPVTRCAGCCWRWLRGRCRGRGRWYCRIRLVVKNNWKRYVENTWQRRKHGSRRSPIHRMPIKEKHFVACRKLNGDQNAVEHLAFFFWDRNTYTSQLNGFEDRPATCRCHFWASCSFHQLLEWWMMHGWYYLSYTCMQLNNDGIGGLAQSPIAGVNNDYYYYLSESLHQQVNSSSFDARYWLSARLRMTSLSWGYK